MMAHSVAHLKIVKNSHIVLGGQTVLFASLIPHDNGIFGVIVDGGIIISGVMAAVFLFDGFVNHHAVPGFASFSGDDGIERNQQKHSSDTQADEHRLRVFHLTAGFAVNVKANDRGDSGTMSRKSTS